MSILMLVIIAIVVIVIIIAIVYYTSESKRVVYRTTLGNKVLYNGSDQPYVSSDDYESIAVAAGRKIFVFNGEGMLTKTITTQTDLKGIAYNATESRYMVIDSQSRLYVVNNESISLVDTGYTSLYDTKDGYYTVFNDTELIIGGSNDKNPVNGDYGLFEIVTTRI